MSSIPRHDECIDILEGRIFAAETITPDLVSEVISACERVSTIGTTTKDELKRLASAGAWTDAALTLVDLAQPRWHLRRLVQDDGEWLCTLSRQPKLPLECDELVETRHELLPLAILSALLQARRQSAGFAAGTIAGSQDASWPARRRPQQAPFRREAFVTASVIVLAALVLFCAGMLAPAVWTALVDPTQIHTSHDCAVLQAAADRHECIEELSKRAGSHPAKGANAPSSLRLSGQHTDLPDAAP